MGHAGTAGGRRWKAAGTGSSVAFAKFRPLIGMKSTIVFPWLTIKRGRDRWKVKGEGFESIMERSSTYMTYFLTQWRRVMAVHLRDGQNMGHGYIYLIGAAAAPG
jgi:hypothetical protein